MLVVGDRLRRIAGSANEPEARSRVVAEPLGLAFHCFAQDLREADTTLARFVLEHR
jgi:hypothetical protein